MWCSIADQGGGCREWIDVEVLSKSTRASSNRTTMEDNVNDIYVLNPGIFYNTDDEQQICVVCILMNSENNVKCFLIFAFFLLCDSLIRGRGGRRQSRDSAAWTKT